MIKINLLETEKERRPKAGVAAGVSPAIVALAVFGAAAAIFIFSYFRISIKLSNLQQDVEKLRIKKKELEPYIKQVEELERRRNELAKKNHAIEELRSQRTIPVHILDEVSRALPEYLWLTNLTLQGNSLGLEGETLQEQAIPTFMRSLEASRFIGQNSLIETSKKPQSRTGAASTAFKIGAPLTNPFAPKPPPATTTSTPAKTQ